MTQEKNTVLTPEEQAQLAENLPMLLQAIESGSPIASAWLAQWRSKRTLDEEATEQATANLQRKFDNCSKQPSVNLFGMVSCLRKVGLLNKTLFASIGEQNPCPSMESKVIEKQ